jgi:hypothetical protein
MKFSEVCCICDISHTFAKNEVMLDDTQWTKIRYNLPKTRTNLRTNFIAFTSTFLILLLLVSSLAGSFIIYVSICKKVLINLVWCLRIWGPS